MLVELRPGRPRLGLPALAGVGVGVAIIWTLCVLWVIHLQHRLTTEAGKTQ